MKLYKKLTIMLILAFASFAFSCDLTEGDTLYKVSIIGSGIDTIETGYFSGMYLVDPEDDSSSWVPFTSTVVDGTSYEEYNLDIDFTTSISIFADGSDTCTSLKLYFYINGSQEEYISDSAVFEGGDISSYAFVELYYDTGATTTE